MAGAGDARGHLRLFVHRIEELELGVVLLNSQKTTVFAEAKKVGLRVKALKSVIQARRDDPKKLEDVESMFADYAAATGLDDAVEKVGAMVQDQEAVMKGDDKEPPEAPPPTRQGPLPPTPPAPVEADTMKSDIDAMFDGEEEEENPPTPPVPHGPALTKTTFGDMDLDGADDVEPKQEARPGRQTNPKVNMDFPDGAVPDAFKKTY